MSNKLDWVLFFLIYFFRCNIRRILNELLSELLLLWNSTALSFLTIRSQSHHCGIKCNFSQIVMLLLYLTSKSSLSKFYAIPENINAYLHEKYYDYFLIFGLSFNISDLYSPLHMIALSAWIDYTVTNIGKHITCTNSKNFSQNIWLVIMGKKYLFFPIY